jgi:hypothetical protein
MKFIICLLPMLVSSAALAGSSQPYGKGGWIAQFQPVIDQYNASGELMRIEGHCQSNCTLFLGLRNVCVPNARRGFCFTRATTGSATSMPAPPRG